jgi:hypothetical protein
MQFYIHKGRDETCGTEGRSIWRDLKTTRGAMARANRTFGDVWRLYTFTNFYDQATFRLVGGKG